MARRWSTEPSMGNWYGMRDGEDEDEDEEDVK
jgi:hypothetical protein